MKWASRPCFLAEEMHGRDAHATLFKIDDGIIILSFLPLCYLQKRQECEPHRRGCSEPPCSPEKPMRSELTDPARQSPQPSAPAARVGASLLFVFLTGISLFFLAMIGRSVYQVAETWRWPMVTCVIESSSIESRRNDYRFKIQYHYDFAGETRHSDRFTMHDETDSSYARLQRLALRYPPGATASCSVNPAHPSEAVLQLENLWILPFALIPLILLWIGAGGLYFMWFPGSIQNPRPPAPRKTLSPTWLFGIFILMGGGLFYLMSVRVFLDMASARQWIPIPCVIESSRVQSHNGEHGTTYRVDIRYAYQANGREYRSNRHDFMAGSSSGNDGKLAITRTFPPGLHTLCYVNPQDPADAVLNRGFTTDMLYGLIPLIFLAVGLIGLTRKWGKTP